MRLEKVRCERMNVNGEGFVVLGDRVHAVRDLLPGETADLEVADGIATVVTRQVVSAARVKPRCPQYDRCGGCSLQHLAYAEQLILKTEYVRERLVAAGLPVDGLLACIGMKEPWNYRNKIQMAVSAKGRKIQAGFYEENTRKIVNADACDIQDARANAIVHTCKRLFEKHGIEPCRDDREGGLIRHVFVRVAQATGQILVAFVTRTEMFPGRNNLVTDLRAAHPEITTIVQNVNPRVTPVVLGDFERVLYGRGTIDDELLGFRFRIGTRTFYQVNPRQAELLYRKALEFAKPKATDLVVDAYSGVGTITLAFAREAKKAVGVEINAASVKYAIHNARANGIRNVEFVEGDAGRFLADLKATGTIPDILVVDPPRAGLDAAFLDTLRNVKPAKLVYVSCDPATLARDLVPLVADGYQLRRVQPVDMFCQTAHVETIVLLSMTTV